MDDHIRNVVEEHHAYYEVSPYFVVIEEGHGSPAMTTRRIQAGFDVDIYGSGIENDPPWQAHNYEIAYSKLKQLARETALHMGESCSIEAIPFYSDIYFDNRNHFEPQAMLRIRVRHNRVEGQPLGPAEGRALAEIEKELASMGIRSGKGSGF